MAQTVLSGRDLSTNSALRPRGPAPGAFVPVLARVQRAVGPLGPANWSITQFTPASMDVQPQNLAERVFTVVVVIFALVGFSYIVGSITGSLGQLRSMHAEESTLFWDLKRYLARNKVPRALSVRIQKYLEHAWQAQREKKSGKNVKLVSLLSEQLRSELKFEMAVPQMRIHPLLDSLINNSKVTVHRLANVAIEHKLLAAGDCLFYPMETANHMYIVVEGKFNYARLDSFGGLHKELVDKAEDWIAEAALWAGNWVHRGLCKAIEDSDNLTIDSNKFAEQVKLNPQAHEFVSSYARIFLEWLNSENPNNLSDISQGEYVSEQFAAFIPSTTSFRGGGSQGQSQEWRIDPGRDAFTPKRMLIADLGPIAHPAHDHAASQSGSYRRSIGDVSSIPARCPPLSWEGLPSPRYPMS
ncbi:unnamed protein product [Prorocentrum cordatum]|uniref:Cyclic nucleotide-binding domain-containing protein n=1 Tax=Prorocentrum cordatum TaxID=2364126 RepID=A0ABN9YAF3_9DINO|nr:unnamed protein product [Polarella glacialis]